VGHIDKTTTFCKEQYRRHGTNAVIFCLLTALSQVKLKKVLLALGFALSSLTLIAPTPSKAEGGCPGGFYPESGGYCRNIICIDTIRNGATGQLVILGRRDISAEEAVRKQNKSCGNNIAGNPRFPNWGDKYLPKR
jgi:hypothetical protein